MMALILIGFVVDDAIVVLENRPPHGEWRPAHARGLEGAREVSFTTSL
jgi:multidrug efflux pump subunit AcrB